MIAPEYSEYLKLREYLVIRLDGTVCFKYDINKFYTKKFARMNFERRITWQEYQEYYQSILNMMVGIYRD